MNTHILLTGGTGFFGKALLRHLAAQALRGQVVPRVTLLSRDPQSFGKQYPALVALPGLDLVRGDICNAGSLPSDIPFTHVLHAAAESTNGPALSPLQRYDQIVQGTRNLLDLALHCGAKRFLLTSSGAVYGPQPPDLAALPETWLVSPDSMRSDQAYGMGKRAAEHLCALYAQAHGIETVVARCFAFVGPDLPLDVHFAIGNFIRDALWANAIAVHGDGSPVRSYMDQSDLTHWLFVLLERGRSGQAYNVGSPHAIRIGALAELVRDTLAPDKPVHILGQPNPLAQRNLYVPDVTKAGGELGLSIQMPLCEAIARTAAAQATGSRLP